MKIKSLFVIFLFCAGALFAQLQNPLQRLSTYKYGDSKDVIAVARAYIFNGTQNPQVRAEHTAILQAFLESAATDESKLIAIDWLGKIGGKAALEKLLQSDTPAFKRESEAVLAALAGLNEDDVRVLKNVCGASQNGALTTSAASGAALKLAAIAEGTDKTAASLALQEYINSEKDGVLASSAISLLGKVGRADDFVFLKSIYKGSDANKRLAAENAISVLDSSLDLELIKTLSSGEDADKSDALDFLVLRNSYGAALPVLECALENSGEISKKAWESYGSLAHPSSLSFLMASFAASDDAQKSKNIQDALWNLIRRVRYEYAKTEFEKLKPSFDDVKQKKISAMVERIAPPPPAAAPIPPSEIPLRSSDSRSFLMPNGFKEIIYLDCGLKNSAANGGVNIIRSKGASFVFDIGDPSHPYSSVDFDSEKLVYNISGLDSANEYVMGFTWYDPQGLRRQKILVNGKTVFGPSAACAYLNNKITYSTFFIPVNPSDIQGGKIEVSIEKLAGPNAVCSEIFIVQKSADKASKKLLIVSGDEYHDWRKNQAEMASILRAAGFTVCISENVYALSAENLEYFDGIVLMMKNYADRLPTDAALWHKLESYVKNGGGLMLSHFACGALQEWEGFEKIVGRVWDPKLRGHDPLGNFTVNVCEAAANGGVKDFTVCDELYTCLRGDTQINVLCSAVSAVDSKTYPIAFGLDCGKGRVYSNTLGHDARSLRNPNVMALYAGGAKWITKQD